MATDFSRRNRIVEENLGLAYSEAARSCWQKRGLSFDELRAVARFALFSAAEGFDSSRGNCFSTYAVVCIRHALQDSIRLSKTIRVPKSWESSRKSALQEFSKLENEKLTLCEKVEKIAKNLHTSEKSVKNWLSLEPNANSLSFSSPDDEDSEIEIKSNTQTPEESFIRKESEQALKSALCRLRRRDEKAFNVLARHRGLFSANGKGEAFAEIGRSLGMAKQNASAIERRALRFLANTPEIRALAQ